MGNPPIIIKGNSPTVHKALAVGEHYLEYGEMMWGLEMKKKKKIPDAGGSSNVVGDSSSVEALIGEESAPALVLAS